VSAPPQPDRIAVLAIAYHNIGVENEFLKRYEQSMQSYRKGVEVAEKYLGPKHPICSTLKNSLISAKKAALKSTGRGDVPANGGGGGNAAKAVGGRK
jgi:hypothetical protein